MSYLVGSLVDVMTEWEALQEYYHHDASLLLHPLHGLQEKGLWATWHRVWSKAHDMKFTRQRTPHPPRWVEWKELRRRLYDSHVGSLASIRGLLLRRLEEFNPHLDPRKMKELQEGILIRVCRRMSRVILPGRNTF